MDLGAGNVRSPRMGELMSRWLYQRRVWAGALTLALACGILIVSHKTRAVPPRLARPNIVFVYSDDQSQESITAQAMPYLSGDPHGYWWKGDLIYNNSQCCPSRAAFLSGQDGHNNGVTDNNSGDNLNVNNTYGTSSSWQMGTSSSGAGKATTSGY